MKKFGILFLLFSILYIPAQVVSGTVLSNDEKKPIPYVKIGVEKESIGVISDEKGNFTIDLSKANPSHKVKIEVPGYENFSQNITDFIKQNPKKITLNEKVKDIQEVKIAPKKLVDKNWGVTTKTKSVTYSLNRETSTKDYLETALEFKTSKRAKIKNINLNVVKIDSENPILMRYSIYSEKNGFPDKNILNDEITVELTEDKVKDGTFTLDVNDRNIWVQGKFFVGIQFLRKIEGGIRISAALFRTGYIREFYGDWMKMSIAAPAINIDVKVDKNGKNTNDEVTDNNDRVTLLSPDLSEYTMESDASVYGKNEAVGKTVKLKDAILYYETYGEGEPLFLLHGNGGSIKEFYKQIPELSKHFKIIALDTRSQGKSEDFTKGALTYKIFADDLKNIMDQLNLSKANILGWSDGGNTGLEFALKYPQNVEKLIIIGANAYPQGVDGELLKNFKNKVQIMELSPQPEYENEKRLLNLMLSEPNIAGKSLNSIKIPVFVIAGENDVIRKEHTEMLAKEIPNAKLKIYPKVSHYLPFEIPDELNKDVVNFLKN